jgi:hypothetical protein
MLADQEQTPADVPPKKSNPVFRSAEVDEDDLLARILCNAFLPVWLVMAPQLDP